MKRLSNAVCSTILALFLAFSLVTLVPRTAYAAQPSHQSSSVLVQGTTAAGDVLSGVLKVTNFAIQNNQLVATGTLNGTITSATGAVSQIVNTLVSIPLSGASASCQILNLTLGPVDLNLLGLTVHLNQVVLNITAVPGNGNLLGNLLCDVAGLLNSSNLSGLLTQVAGLLNQILASL